MKKLLLLPLALALAADMHAAIFRYDAVLDGLSESPQNASPGTGLARVTFDDVLNTMRVQVTFSGLVGTTTASHIHAPTAVAGTGTANVATTTPTFVGFPLGVTSGSFDNTFDMTLASSYRAAYLSGFGGSTALAFTALANAAADGKAYLNIHTSAFTGGEIRGFLTPVPEPGVTGAIAGVAAVVLALRQRRNA
jgi:hypothetical protein